MLHTAQVQHNLMANCRITVEFFGAMESIKKNRVISGLKLIIIIQEMFRDGLWFFCLAGREDVDL